jgi:toxin ParE1/3/4
MQTRDSIPAYVLSKPAEEDLAQILEQGVEIWGIDQATEYAKLIDDALYLLAKHPQLGHDRSHIKPNVRSFRVESHIIFYRQQPAHLEVIRILHKRMDFESHL